MPHSISSAASSKRILDSPFFLPVKILFSPFSLTIHIVKKIFETFVGHFVKLGVFPFGSIKKSWFDRQIIQIYQGGCYDTHDRALLNPKRLNDAFKVLKEIGGIPSDVNSKDGTKLDTMILRYRDVKDKIERKGGIFTTLPISITSSNSEKKILTTVCSENPASKESADLIIPDQNRNIHDWADFCKNILDPCYLEKTLITLKDGRKAEGYILKHWDTKKEEIIRPKENQCFIRCNAPTESYPMAKRDIMRHVLGMRSDVFCFDYPGTANSEGNLSEGTYYLAAETMVEKAVDEYGYSFKDIWATGFCLGGAVAAHLKYKYHDKGINLATQNTFNRIYNTLRQQIWPASFIAPIGINELKSKNPEVIRQVEQDCFDTIQKFERIQNVQNGVSIILNTDTDTTVDPKSHEQINEAIARVSKKHFGIWFTHPDKKKNGHSFDVLGERKVWDVFVKYVALKDHPSEQNIKTSEKVTIAGQKS